MPIKGLTDRGAAFPEIGRVRKGAKKTKNAPGSDLDYFRVEFDEQETRTADAFKAVYGDKPDEINILLPFNGVDENFEAWREAYVRGGLIHRCDGEQVIYEVNQSTGEKVVVNAQPFKACNRSSNCKPVGRLKVLVPELQRLAYLTVLTGSVHDIMNISQQLEALLQMRGKLAGIPLKLRRRPREISTPSGENGKRARRTKWLLSVEADPDWVKCQLTAMKQAALPGNGLSDVDVPMLEAPIDDEWDDEVEVDSDQAVVEEAEVREMDEAPAPQNGNSYGERPYDPDVLKRGVAKKVEYIGEYNASDKQRGLLRGSLELLFAGDPAAEQKYRTVAKELTGVDSTSKMTGAQIKALLDWVDVTEDSGGSLKPGAMAVKEARMVENAALLDAGQTELPV